MCWRWRAWLFPGGGGGGKWCGGGVCPLPLLRVRRMLAVCVRDHLAVLVGMRLRGGAALGAGGRGAARAGGAAAGLGGGVAGLPVSPGGGQGQGWRAVEGGVVSPPNPPLAGAPEGAAADRQGFHPGDVRRTSFGGGAHGGGRPKPRCRLPGFQTHFSGRAERAPAAGHPASPRTSQAANSSIITVPPPCPIDADPGSQSKSGRTAAEPRRPGRHAGRLKVLWHADQPRPVRSHPHPLPAARQRCSRHSPPLPCHLSPPSPGRRPTPPRPPPRFNTRS